jgi:hypothetical protein
MKATIFNQYVSLMMDRFRLKVDNSVGHLEDDLSKLTAKMKELCLSYYRGDRTPSFFFDRLLYLSFCFWYAYGRKKLGHSDVRSVEEWVDEWISRIHAKHASKAAEYVTNPDKDRLENFKQVSRLNGRLCWIDCWFVYVAKHIISCDLFTISGIEKTEPITERAEDIGNYATLGLALCDEWNQTHSGLSGAKHVAAEAIR